MILVDAAVRIELLRARQTMPVEHLLRLIDLGEAAVAPVIIQEILQGTVDSRAFERLAQRFTAVPLSGAENPLALHAAAARLYARARWQGITPRSPHDCLIAAIAVEHGVPLLLHHDRDFDVPGRRRGSACGRALSPRQAVRSASGPPTRKVLWRTARFPVQSLPGLAARLGPTPAAPCRSNG